MAIISPSILSCDYSKMGEEILRMEQAGADWLHFDVMDGCFVPNLTIGAPVIKSLKKCSNLVFDVHLMITDPLRYIEDFAKAGADIITFHIESDSNVLKTLKAIKDAGCRAGISLKPKTSAHAVFPYLALIDMVLVMTVEPGFGGQSFMDDMMPKISAIRRECDLKGFGMDIEVDGGINETNISKAANAGANVFVSGNTIFKADDSKEMISLLRENANVII
ncbi:MAG: ribulose-phosphate 3-epimerase [Oscillospiraceae bacterium]|jgi:ribulose-phosphate 3-epimerase|nr:ribulose-phosphate 3-epimerase [Oscillospiraceae bacterium]